MKDSKNPEHGSEGHGAEDGDLDLVLYVEVLDVFDEFGEHGEPYELTFGDEVSPNYGGEGEGVDNDARAFCEDGVDPAWEGQSAFCWICKASECTRTFEGEVRKKRHIVCFSSLLRQSRKHQKPSPSCVVFVLSAPDTAPA